MQELRIESIVYMKFEWFNFIWLYGRNNKFSWLVRGLCKWSESLNGGPYSEVGWGT